MKRDEGFIMVVILLLEPQTVFSAKLRQFRLQQIIIANQFPTQTIIDAVQVLRIPGTVFL